MMKLRLCILVCSQLLFASGSVLASLDSDCDAELKEQERSSVEVNRDHRVVTHETEILVNKPIDYVYQRFLAIPLEDQFPGTKKIPGVVSTLPMNSKSNDEAGFLRVVCLKDGNIAWEEILHVEKEKYYYYKVWDFSINQAKQLKYATGEFTFIPKGDTTLIHWRYSFKLDEDRMLGKMGGMGRWMLKHLYVKRGFDTLMDTGLSKMKKLYES